MKKVTVLRNYFDKELNRLPNSVEYIIFDKDFNKSILNTADSFHILQGNDSFYYQNLRIVRNNGLYSYYGVTHEYINTPSNNTLVTITKDVLFIRDYGDGGCKSDKYERDIRLLLNGIKEEPNNQRYYFYLANSYHDSGRYGEAINVDGIPQTEVDNYISYKSMTAVNNFKNESSQLNSFQSSNIH